MTVITSPVAAGGATRRLGEKLGASDVARPALGPSAAEMGFLITASIAAIVSPDVADPDYWAGLFVLAALAIAFYAVFRLRGGLVGCSARCVGAGRGA